MSTTPVTPSISSVTTTIDKDLQDSLASLAHKHVTISYTLIGLLIVVLIAGGVGAYFTAKWVDKEMSQAQEAEKTYSQQQQVANQANLQYQQEVTAHNADRAQWAAQQAKLIQSYTSRNQTVTQQISQVTLPGKTAADTYADLHNAYKDNQVVSGVALQTYLDPTTKETLMGFPTPVVQQFSATKLDDDLQKTNVDSLNQQLVLEQDKTSSALSDSNSCQVSLKAQQTATQSCQVALNDYKKLAVVSKFKKILGGAIKVALFFGGIILGHYF